MSEKLGKRKAEQALWEHHKPTIMRLFIVEGKTADEVCAILAKDYNFRKE